MLEISKSHTRFLVKATPILLISGSGNVMDVWPLPLLLELSSNHTVIIFDNRGVGNTTSGTGPFTIDQFANDTVGLLDALNIRKADSWVLYGFFYSSTTYSCASGEG